ncbi:MAG: chaperone NapD [Planctomycetes bacterium]|nr:chaperone NapD [Planctomycetota bacterium]MCB9904520.1 chaperone NapD [Planctomycetota bacterium]
MTVVGIFVRTEIQRLEEVRAHLAALPGVRPVELEEEGCLGLVLEAPSLNAAHDRLRGEIERAPGVLTAWPVQIHDEPERELRPSHQGLGSH